MKCSEIFSRGGLRIMSVIMGNFRRLPAPRRLLGRESLAGGAGLFVAAIVAALCLALAGESRGQEAAPADANRADAPQRRRGRLIRIAGNADSRVYSSVQRQCEEAIRRAKEKSEWPVLVFEIHPGRIDVFDAEKLARYIASPNLSGAYTVAYLPKPVVGHAVLLAMACNEIVMAPEASIGDAGKYEPEGDRTVSPRVRSAYVDVAGLRRTVSEDVAVSLVDPASELLFVQTEKSGRYVLRENLAALAKIEAVDANAAKSIKKPGTVGVFSADEARSMNIVKFVAKDRAVLARELKLSPDDVKDDPSAGGAWRTALWRVKGIVDKELTDKIQNGISKEIQDNDVNFICLWIDSAGGSPNDAINLANYLISLNAAERRTVAYIPKRALGDAAFIALACDQIIVGNGAAVGGSGDLVLDPENIPAAVAAVRHIAASKLRSPAVAAGIVDPKAVVFEYRRVEDGVVEFFTEADAEALDAMKWQYIRELKSSGRPLQLVGEKAVTLGIAREMVGDFAEFKAIYDLQDDPRFIEPSWAESLVEAMSKPGVAVWLLIIGGVALIIEMKAPGIGIGGIISAICFLLYFWSAYLGGTAGWLEVILFCTGLVLLLMEIFVLPGFGLFGLAGGLLVVFSLVLASQTFVVPRNEYQLLQLRNSLLTMAGAGLGIFATACAIRSYFPKAPGFNRMLLAPPSGEEAADIARRESLTQWEGLLGKTGVATTPLMPGGKARFDEELVDVIAEGQAIDRGQEVKVVEVRGNRVVVRAIS